MFEDQRRCQLSVQCQPTFKDSVIGDILDWYTRNQQKAIVICDKNSQVQSIYSSTYIDSHRLMVLRNDSKVKKHELYDKFRTDDNFQCLIATFSQPIWQLELEAKVIIFHSPPQTSYYATILNASSYCLYFITIYSKQEKQQYQKLKKANETEIIELIPPDVKETEPSSVYDEIKVFIKNLPKSTNKHDLLSFFASKQIYVKSVSIKGEPGKDFKFAIVSLYNKKTFEAALQLNQSRIKGRTIIIDRFKNKE